MFLNIHIDLIILKTHDQQFAIYFNNQKIIAYHLQRWTARNNGKNTEKVNNVSPIHCHFHSTEDRHLQTRTHSTVKFTCVCVLFM